MKKTISAIFLAVTLGAIIYGFCYVTNLQTEYISYSCTPNSGNGDYEITVEIAKEADGSLKQWTLSNGFIGAQYDITIYNRKNDNLYDWSVSIPLPAGSYIDSGWDSTYEITDNVLTSHPMEYNQTLFANSQRTLGFVLYLPNEYTLADITLTGTSDFTYSDSSKYHILLIASAVWFCALCLTVSEAIRKRVYEARRAHDHAMIHQSISTFINFIDAKDAYTRGHSNRVALYAKEIAKRMKFPETEVNNLYYIALLHDAGKIGITDSILNKNGPLTPEERKIIESHTTIGGDMLRTFTSLDGIIDGALYHHERFDGKGYPVGLKGTDIPLYARIICVADAYDAMSSNRCYRPHLEKTVILEELKQNAGSQFDPDIVKHMIAMIHDGFVDTIRPA